MTIETCTHWISEFCIGKEGNSFTREPMILDGMTVASDGRILVAIREVITGFPEPDEKTAKTIRDLLQETNRLGGCRIDLAELRKWAGKYRTERSVQCRDCHGTGTYECSECGQEAKCQDCDGVGTTIEYPDHRPGKCFEVVLSRNLLAKALAHLGGDECRVSFGKAKSVSGADDPVRFEAPQWIVLQMPMHTPKCEDLGDPFGVG